MCDAAAAVAAAAAAALASPDSSCEAAAVAASAFSDSACKAAAAAATLATSDSSCDAVAALASSDFSCDADAASALGSSEAAGAAKQAQQSRRSSTAAAGAAAAGAIFGPALVDVLMLGFVAIRSFSSPRRTMSSPVGRRSTNQSISTRVSIKVAHEIVTSRLSLFNPSPSQVSKRSILKKPELAATNSCPNAKKKSHVWSESHMCHM